MISTVSPFPRTPYDPPLINASVPPTRLVASSGSGWDGALLVDVTVAPAGEVDQEHEFVVVERRVTPLCLRKRGAPGGCRTHGPGSWLCLPGDRMEGEWRGVTALQYLFITPERAQAILGKPWDRSGLLRWSQKVADLPIADNILAALALDARDGHPAGPIVGDSLLVALLGHLDAMAAAPKVPRKGAFARRIHVARDYIEANLARPLSLPELAAVGGVSVRQFGAIFAAETGWPPHRFVLHRRVERAKELIAAPELSLGEIAQRVGFASPAQFSRVFRRYTGMTPRAYRYRQR